MPPSGDSPAPTTAVTFGVNTDQQHPATRDQSITNTREVAPPIHLTTTFEYAQDPDLLIPAIDRQGQPVQPFVYSRESAPNLTRLEDELSVLTHGKAITYANGLAALFAVYTYFKPRNVALSPGYHGSLGVLQLHQKLTSLSIVPLSTPSSSLQPGDIIHLETPVNPTGESLSIAHYAQIAHSAGAYLLVDSTFAPPGLQNPFDQGADIVMHSGTKYLGGHSDMLAGVITLKDDERGRKWAKELLTERTILGSIMGSMEQWLCLRSLKTLELRVARQSESAEKLVRWLYTCLSDDNKLPTASGTAPTANKPTQREIDIVRRVVKTVHHSSLQGVLDPSTTKWLPAQMPNGYSPVFGLSLKTPDLARHLPSHLTLFKHATSLGGVESLIEWRALSDKQIEQNLLRVSVGVEKWELLKGDLLGAFEKLGAASV
ncbi:cystathionine beta-lyase [Fimicolochytrium jonesii]|uniref:cystathionine beta-lyase n=1 Tax=Fimicolochytrium jonesii TaxID=1396493 RepID=UPI0022FDC578|nr:cystathionine beta-lyase [Fimicolochytrium jonesii]KAI8826713.1 cystathionine beta-lyase [Fimicolochytrium jonesii]